MGKDTKKLLQAWQTYISDGIIQDFLQLEIQKSWQRCSNYDISPNGNSKNQILVEQKLRIRKQEYQNLIKVATPMMRRLYKSIKGSGFWIILTDGEGFILKSVGDKSFNSQARDVHLIEGANWNEEFKGTNAIGTVIEEGNSLNVYGSEHFLESNHALTCSAAPILDKNNNLLGVLDISGAHQADQGHTLGMVISAAQLIQRELLLMELEDELNFSRQKQNLILNYINRGLFTINRQGIITQINQAGSSILGYSAHECIGKRLDEFFPKFNFAVLFNQQEDGMRLNSSDKKLVSKVDEVLNGQNNIEEVIVELNPSQAKRSLVKNDKQIDYSFANIIGESDQMLKVINLAKKVASSNSTVLLTGESGTGKELFAQAIHHKSFRRESDFVVVNCGAIPDNLIESELFGYKGGSFTGAKKEGKKGKFLMADGGTIFLDEIGEMPLNSQVKLLRALQEKQISPVGSNQVISIDLRVIAATNKDLKEMMAQGKFREDLYYRLNVIEIKLPALRERREDIITLAKYFITKLEEVMGKSNIKLTKEAKRVLLDYNWPGNVRELENVIERALNLLEGSKIEIEDLPDQIREYQGPTPKKQKLLSLEEAEAKVIKEALKHFNNNISQTAKHLDLARNTLYRKIKEYSIKV